MQNSKQLICYEKANDVAFDFIPTNMKERDEEINFPRFTYIRFAIPNFEITQPFSSISNQVWATLLIYHC